MTAPALPTELVPLGHLSKGAGRSHYPVRERVNTAVALRFARDHPKPVQLMRALHRMLRNEDVLHRRNVPPPTLAQAPKYPTPMKVINVLAAELHKAPKGFEHLLTALHGSQRRMCAEDILLALHGAGIGAPEMKKRGRARKN